MDRNRDAGGTESVYNESLSARRAWIEITISIWTGFWKRVALRKESVDRNLVSRTGKIPGSVALRKESVDRNHRSIIAKSPYSVALRKESVDRNILFANIFEFSSPSLSARRAWIEICWYL